MTWLQNCVVTFRLSSLGRQELQGIFGETSFSAYVADANETGAWIIFDGTDDSKTAPSFLLKWDYVSTASLEISLADEDSKSARRQIGFR